MTTLIVGGGLSGLALADAFEEQGRDYMLVEARARFGGRILTEHLDAGYFDMGPAWFWDGQPRIKTLISRLGLEKFEQFSDGILSYEDEAGHVERGRGFSSMQGSWRLNGGLAALTNSLADGIPIARKRLNTSVTTIAKTHDGIKASFTNGEQIAADEVAFALPPRVVAELSFEPTLPERAVHTMTGIATWMAGQAKAVAVYDRPFWREAGLSGDAMSRHGPMVEIHDASPAAGGPYALFGFIGVPPHARTNEQELREHLKAQLGRIFGSEAAVPTKLYLKDWAFDPLTATKADQAPLYAHPIYGLPQDLIGIWDGRLYFAGTEVAPQFGGYVEGALEAAENILETLKLKDG
ncbi:MAG: FAD-dependent oxidoreductase [Aliishimia sp.]